MLKDFYQESINKSMENANNIMKKENPETSEDYMSVVDKATQEYKDASFYEDLKFNVLYHIMKG